MKTLENCDDINIWMCECVLAQSERCHILRFLFTQMYLYTIYTQNIQYTCKYWPFKVEIYRSEIVIVGLMTKLRSEEVGQVEADFEQYIDVQRQLSLDTIRH